MTPLRLCIINHLAGLDGGERSMLTLARYLCQHDCDVKIILPTTGPLQAALDQEQIDYRIVRFPWWARVNDDEQPRSVYESAAAIVALLKQWRTQVVYSNTSVIHAGAFAAMMAGLPHVWHPRESAFSDKRFAFSDPPDRVCQIIGMLSNAVICNSHSLADEYRPHVPAEKLHVVYNHVELDQTDADAGDAQWQALRQNAGLAQGPRLIIVGTVCPQKGQLEAVQALAHLHQRGLHAHLLIAGTIPPDNDYVQQIKSFVQARGLVAHVHWLGFVHRPLAWLRWCDLTLVCTHFETFGRVAAESLMLGVPVVGAAAGGTRELVDDGVSGLLYPPGDAADLADKIHRLLSDPSLRQRLAAAAPAAIAAKTSLEQYGGRILSILRQAADAAPPLGQAGQQLYSPHIDAMHTEMRDIKTSRAWRMVTKLWKLTTWR